MMTDDTTDGYTIQNIAPIKNDWCMQIKSDLELCNINLSEAEISTMKKEHFNPIYINIKFVFGWW